MKSQSISSLSAEVEILDLTSSPKLFTWFVGLRWMKGSLRQLLAQDSNDLPRTPWDLESGGVTTSLARLSVDHFL